MGGGGGTSVSRTSNNLPVELRNLYSQTGEKLLDLQEQFPLDEYMTANPLQTAGPGALESGAASRVGYLWGNTPQQEQAERMNQSLWGRSNQTFGGADNLLNTAERMRTSGVPGHGLIDSNMNNANRLAAKRVASSAGDIANDAALQASRDAFMMTTLPTIDNQTSVNGLLRSGERDKIAADAWAKNSTPHVMAAIQRDDDRINRMLSTQMGTIDDRMQMANLANQRQWQAMGAQSDALNLKNATGQYQMNLADQMGNFGAREWDQMKGAIDTGMSVGGVMTGYENDAYKAAYDDYLRRQGLAEKSLYAPFGQVGNLVGSTTTQSGGGK
jgi:hypothetical protein